jgi:hypothetical protein
MRVSHISTAAATAFLLSKQKRKNSCPRTGKILDCDHEAFDAFCKYRDLGVGRRSLAEVTRMLRAEARERRGLSATLILPPEFEQPTADEQSTGYTKATRRPKNSGNHSGQVGRWAKKYSWVERASAWDDHLDARNRERQLDEITKMAKRHAEQIEVALGVVIQPIREFMKSRQDRGRADMRTESSMKLLDTRSKPCVRFRGCRKLNVSHAGFG